MAEIGARQESLQAPGDRRAAILARSAELFATRGVAATTVRHIGEAAGVLSGSLYHHFPSKDAIVGEVLRAFMEDIQRRFAEVARQAGTPEETVRRLVHETLAVIEEHPHPTAMYQNDRQYLRDRGLLEPVDSASRAVRSHWLEALEAGIADGTFRGDVPPEVFYRALRDTLWATMHWPNRKDFSTEEFADLLIDLFLHGLRRPAG
ncbi:DNA-binding transcriptional regulator, AcrR family [Blastococcus sp. DSM 46786]|uniref:TetR/AcrR family transcriptional regulator n=1 Tax=Blastococcus sp. DSM 46786 TaxID=1798227 RepID=UPI0008C7597C|nr:TetR/AcrR family transcriptional regulator [Blastococcus sp. DSM 46786]SEK71874.1 DNA-binding transcriptional regulator, AcrR family [Blastococcus sp. DSM 46786]